MKAMFPRLRQLIGAAGVKGAISGVEAEVAKVEEVARPLSARGRAAVPGDHAKKMVEGLDEAIESAGDYLAAAADQVRELASARPPNKEAQVLLSQVVKLEQRLKTAATVAKETHDRILVEDKKNQIWEAEAKKKAEDDAIRREQAAKQEMDAAVQSVQSELAPLVSTAEQQANHVQEISAKMEVARGSGADDKQLWRMISASTPHFNTAQQTINACMAFGAGRRWRLIQQAAESVKQQAAALQNRARAAARVLEIATGVVEQSKRQCYEIQEARALEDAIQSLRKELGPMVKDAELQSAKARAMAAQVEAARGAGAEDKEVLRLTVDVSEFKASAQKAMDDCGRYSAGPKYVRLQKADEAIRQEAAELVRAH